MFRFTKYERVLILLFFLTLPLSNPWVRGDGVGYYAFARAILFGHNLDFTKDWLAANDSFRMGRIDSDGNIRLSQYTVTGHLDNHFTVGPAILWAPFLVAAHLAVKTCHLFGSPISADGISAPYRIAMALSTTLYGFLAIWLSFQLAKKYCEEKWAFLAALGIWFASLTSRLHVFQPFVGARTFSFRRGTLPLVLGSHRSRAQLDPVADSWRNRRADDQRLLRQCGPSYRPLAGITVRVLEKTEGTPSCQRPAALYLRRNFLRHYPCHADSDIYYQEDNLWKLSRSGLRRDLVLESPALLKVCFASDHGLFSWTPILILSVVGLLLLRRYSRDLSFFLTAGFLIYLYTIGCYQDWDGLASFGNRFFVSLTPIFVLGLASFFNLIASKWSERSATAFAYGATALLIVWNLGLIFQWGTHLIPARGPIFWRKAAYNQVEVVPVQAMRTLRNYMVDRKELMDRIEEQDVNQLRSHGE